MDFKESKSEIIDLDNNLKTKIRLWLPENEPKVILLAIHGALTHSGDWVTPAQYFKSKDIGLIGFDLRFHGELLRDKKGHAIHIETYDDYSQDVNTLLDYIKSNYPSIPIFIIAHSMGALIALYYGLKEPRNQTNIKGMILSSPWIENSVKVNPLLLFMSRILNVLTPKLSITPESFNDKLTHDEQITSRIYDDEHSGLRSTKVTARFGRSTLKTQSWVINNIKNWRDYPLFVVVSGEDYIAKPETTMKAFSSVNSNLYSLIKYDENYHENFNEHNREEIFEKINNWIFQNL
ncbi:MAG: alpha/beta fold hydrolase [Candidatus Hodarchaeales archaeon]